MSTQNGLTLDFAGPEVGTVHLVYPHGARIEAPDSIGRNLGKRLQAKYRVVYHNWTDRDEIHPEPGDVLLGHPHPSRDTVFRRSSRRRGWRRVIMLAPYNSDLAQVAFADSVVRHCDLFLAITGPYWFDTLDSSPCSHWKPKMVRLDLAVDRSDFPPVKNAFNEPGKRRFLYIGHTRWMKNTPYLSDIARRMPGTEFNWIGPGDDPIRGLTRLVVPSFATQEARRLVAQFDFLINVSTADANPTAILEAMAWGLVPVCTPQSGYVGIPSIVNVPLGDPEAVAEVLRGLQNAPSERLRSMQDANWALLDAHYNWARFSDQVVEAIESSTSPALGHESFGRRLRFLSKEAPGLLARTTRRVTNGVRRRAARR